MRAELPSKLAKAKLMQKTPPLAIEKDSKAQDLTGYKAACCEVASGRGKSFLCADLAMLMS